MSIAARRLRWRARPTGLGALQQVEAAVEVREQLDARVSERARAAASSIASGTPSSRRHSSAIGGEAPRRLAEARAPAERARSSKSRVAGAASTSSRSPLAGSASGPSTRSCLAVDAERLAARREHAERGARVEERRGRARARRARTCSQLSSTRSAGCVAEAEDERLERREAELTGHLGADVVARRDRRELAAVDAGPADAASSRAQTSTASRVFPIPPGPDDGHEPARGDELGEPRALLLAPEERRDRRHGDNVP